MFCFQRRKKKFTFLIICFLPNAAAQFIYSRRDKPATFAEPLEEEYGYEGTDGTADYFTSNHQLTEVDRGNYRK